ncbi:glycosyl transferase family 2, partial [Candidatus Saccharibacteria bacterium]|nr:glycosyl transferase family 2 [Candidatus Saccharibacteria bacterium]
GGSLSVVNMSFSEGVELSMNAGVDFAIGDFIYEFDSCVIDYPKSIIMDLYHKALEDNDIVVASPNAPIRISSKLFYYLFNKNSLLPQKLTTESIMLLSRRAINRINNQSVTIPYRKAIYARSGLNKATLSFTPIQPSSKSQSYKYRQGIAIDTLILFTNIAYKVAISMSALMMAILLVSAIYAIATFISGQAVAGWTTTILLISFAFFGIFAVLTIVIKYLSLITNLIFRKQTYTIRSTEKFNI